jgi:hypothetical protein
LIARRWNQFYVKPSTNEGARRRKEKKEEEKKIPPGTRPREPTRPGIFFFSFFSFSSFRLAFFLVGAGFDIKWDFLARKKLKTKIRLEKKIWNVI